MTYTLTRGTTQNACDSTNECNLLKNGDLFRSFTGSIDSD